MLVQGNKNECDMVHAYAREGGCALLIAVVLDGWFLPASGVLLWEMDW